ncbi:MAG: RNA-splicing ligase RtcB [Chloroflexi bacterium]|nr:RNA-splicing ligase RtcB [Chloroflexota bacterium]
MVQRKDLRQVGPYVYEIPKTFRDDMRVPARIYADEAIVQAALKDRSIEQLVNTATLPGIVRYALAMPDIHQGYGFSIGGVVATRESDGVISPGGVGYDINCLTGDSLVLHEFGYTRPIAEMAEDWRTASLRCQDFGEGRTAATHAVRFLRRPPRRPLYRLLTEEGDEIIATADHPFWTPDGMVELERLKPGDRVARFPFLGVPYEAPDDAALVDEKDIQRVLKGLGKGRSGNALGQILTQFRQRELLPLRATSRQWPHLLRVLGYAFGDASISFTGESNKGVVWFYGEREDLEQIRADVAAIGFTPSRIYTRTRRHRISAAYDDYEFEREEVAFKVVGSAFASLLAALGAPVGAKASQDYEVPPYLFSLPRWQQRLFLAALFGAELTAPSAIEQHNHNFTTPVLSLNKREGFVESGVRFLEGISRLLAGFGVETKTISRGEEQVNVDGARSHRLRLILSSQPESLINLWGRVGFEYNRKRQTTSLLAVAYLRRKMNRVAARNEAAARAVAMQAAGVAPQAIYAELVGEHVNRRFLERSLYEGRQTGARVRADFETFEEFCREATAGIAGSGMVWTTIAVIETPSMETLRERGYDGYVYDFTVAHHDHNFIANGFVVSNCGVRLLASEMEEEEVRPYLEDLATALYYKVPSGVGVKGFLRLSTEELNEVLEKGAKWALRKGMARREDLKHTEEEGTMPGARADKVSARAKERGRSQLGTLGAGNHFAEIDVVEEIFDEEAADAFGLFPGQVVLQIHCGSRGLGHQVCTDYVQRFQGAVKRYGIHLPDRQLVCAPIQSPEGQDYIAAMAAAANFAWCNRQILAHQAREAFEDVLAGKVDGWDLRMVYDIAHNMAKLETHDIEGKNLRVCVHRKGATRAFGPGSDVLPTDYRDIGQPVLVPGSMGTASYVLAGTPGSMRQTFGSTCHGAGRQLSRRAAKRQVRGAKLKADLEHHGIVIRAGSMKGLAEEAPIAYKDVSRVVEVVHNAGIAKKVARLRPIAVVKG